LESSKTNLWISEPGIIRGFTWQIFPGWNATVLEVSQDQILVRHAPKVGLVFKAQPYGFPFLGPHLYKVEEVEDQIKLGYNPYEAIANKTLEVALTLVDISKSSES
jgi:hypothetical protein